MDNYLKLKPGDKFAIIYSNQIEINIVTGIHTHPNPTETIFEINNNFGVALEDSEYLSNRWLSFEYLKFHGAFKLNKLLEKFLNPIE